MPLKASRSFSSRGGQWRSFINHDASLYLHFGNVSPSSRFDAGFNQRFLAILESLSLELIEEHDFSQTVPFACNATLLPQHHPHRSNDWQYKSSLSIRFEASLQLTSDSLASSLLPKTLCVSSTMAPGRPSQHYEHALPLQTVGEVRLVHRSGGAPDVVNAAPVGLCVAQFANFPQRQGQSRSHVIKTWVPP